MLYREHCWAGLGVLICVALAAGAQEADPHAGHMHHAGMAMDLPDDAGPPVNINGGLAEKAVCAEETTVFNVPSAAGTSSYNINGATDPDITMQRGHTYTFNITTPGHPFNIKTARPKGEAGAPPPEGTISAGDDFGMMREPIDQSDGARGIRKDGVPLFER